MNLPRITLLSAQDKKLREFLETHPSGHERAAIVLFRRIHRQVHGLADSDRYLAVDIIFFNDTWITDSSPSYISFELKHLRPIFQRCEEEKLSFGFVHNHPKGEPDFSHVDESNEITLLHAITNRNGSDIHLVAMLLSNGSWISRVRHGRNPDLAIPVRHTLAIGNKLTLYGYEELSIDSGHMYARQAAAFGKPFVSILRSLRVGVIGAGGTGSPTVTLLARAGIGELVIIDKDVLEESNLNRVRGAGKNDVGKNKSLILKDFITNLKLPVAIAAIHELIDQSPYAVDALSSCDVIFGCTDDQIGREALNASLYIYAQAYIDVGLGGQIIEDDMGHAQLRYHFGRVSTITPEYGECLFCQGVITQEGIRHQYALRENPEMSEEEAQVRYLSGGNEQAPGVGPFTSATADFGVANLFDLIRPFRNLPSEIRQDMYTIDFVKMSIRSGQKRNSDSCPYCKRREYLLLNERYRLNRPALGKVDVSS